MENIFKRYELKYLLNEDTFNQLLDGLEKFMELDQYGLHSISSIYYDTTDFQLIRNSINHKGYKEKLRLRSYGIPTKESCVAVELKKKFEKIVYKRRLFLPLFQAEQYLKDVADREAFMPDFCLNTYQERQILKEIKWFTALNKPVPQVMIAYDRLAYFGKKDMQLRITFDQHIRWRNTDLHLNNGHDGQPLIDKSYILMEVKIPQAMPLWMTSLFTNLGLKQSPFSKYAYCYEHYLNKQQRGQQYARNIA